MFNYKVNVIMGLFNCAETLPEAIDSILNQTYTDWQLIMCNDGSTDSCPMICGKYATQDNRVKVIHKPNGGLSSVREAGINAVSGNFVTIIDGDG